MSKRPFIDTLREIEFGSLLDELASVQQEMVSAVQVTGKAGKITIELAYKPEGNGQLAINSCVKTKMPQLPRGTSIFFVTPERNLTRQDPRQQALPLRSIESVAAPELREVSGNE